jgi:hypothetical protein
MAALDREAAAANLIRDFLRPQETLRAIVEAREDRGDRSDASGRRMSSSVSSVRNRVLAVVSNDELGTEQGRYTSVYLEVECPGLVLISNFKTTAYLHSKWLRLGMNLGSQTPD